MTEREAFLAAIIANSQEDAPRLIFADWLEEQGERERAEFIRVQCELATYKRNDCPNRRSTKLAGIPVIRRDGVCCECRWCLLTKREEELLDKDHCEGTGYLNWVVWSGLSTMSCNLVAPPIFRRGFLAEITFSCKDWLTHGEKLLRSTPLEKATLTDYVVGILRDDHTVRVYPANGSPYAASPIQLFVRDGRLFPGQYTIEVIPAMGMDAIDEEIHEARPILFGNPNAPKPQGLINCPHRR